MARETRKLKVLLVQDDPDDQLHIREALQEIPYEVKVVLASGLDEAVRALEQDQPDVILADDRLGARSGMELIDRIAPSGGGPPVILLTGVDDRDLAMRAGAADYLLKSEADAATLERAIRYALERQRVEQELRTSQERYRRLVESVPLGILRTDDAGRLLQSNAPAEVMTGYSAKKLGGMSLDDLIHPESHVELREALGVVAKGDMPHATLDVRGVTRQGGVLWLQLTISRTASGEDAGLVVLVENVTERRELERQLLLSQRLEAVGQVAGGIAHDFNNVLTIILGFISLMELGVEEHELRKYLREMRSGAERAAELTRQLLAYSRRQILRPEVVDLNEAISRLEGRIRSILGPGVDLVTALQPALPRVEADPGQLEQIFANLASNARDAMEPDGIATIATRAVTLTEADVEARRPMPPGRYVEVTFSDTGVGIEPEILPRVFEPFFTTKEVGRGTGLGLSSVYGYMKQSGGWIWIESRPHEGTTVRLYFPPALQSAEAPTDPGLTPGEEDGKKQVVLVVEDEASVRFLVRKVLERSGFAVLEASNGVEALEILEHHPSPIHLLLTDVLMPGMNGRRLVERALLVRPYLAVVFMSGFAGETLQEKGTIDGRYPFLTKPLAPNQLVQTISEELARAATRV